MKTKLLIAALVAGVAATSVSAAGFGRGGDGAQMGSHPMPFTQDFETLDADGDGALTLEELRAAVTNPFADADTDGDGLLSQEELSAVVMGRMEIMAANRAQMMIAQHDTDGDGLLSSDELQPQDRGRGLAMMFANIDTDADGTITAEEFAAAPRGRQGAMMGQGMDRGHGMGHHGDGGRGVNGQDQGIGQGMGQGSGRAAPSAGN